MADDKESVIIKIQSALLKLDSLDDEVKLDGLVKLNQYLQTKDPQINKLGYDMLIFKDLVKLCNFNDELEILTRVLLALEYNFFNRLEFGDELMKTILCRAAMSRKDEIVQFWLEHLFSLVKHFDSRLAKHADQILQLVDTNHNAKHSTILIKILDVLKTQLPERLPCDVKQ